MLILILIKGILFLYEINKIINFLLLKLQIMNPIISIMYSKENEKSVLILE